MDASELDPAQPEAEERKKNHDDLRRRSVLCRRRSTYREYRSCCLIENQVWHEEILYQSGVVSNNTSDADRQGEHDGALAWCGGGNVLSLAVLHARLMTGCSLRSLVLSTLERIVENLRSRISDVICNDI